MGLWLQRETKDTSVTLTFTTIAFVLYATACIAHSLDLIKGVSELNQLFFSTLAAYIGRKMSFRTKTMSINHDDGPLESEKEDKNEGT